MTANREPTGTTTRDLEAVRAVLRAEDGWTVEEETEADAPWIAATGPDGTAWAIGRQRGEFFAVADHGMGNGWDGLATAWDAACYAADAGQPS